MARKEKPAAKAVTDTVKFVAKTVAKHVNVKAASRTVDQILDQELGKKPDTGGKGSQR
ncbi:hypothetical protein [Amycolatopsis orientalis]|uniref:hypothetical protein n=1 Tax=Amycolatopsis orientalis TaxID=31958 RepID=UPI000A9F2D70|nr:hypothetical protein [Amycolatopsis orientalis]